VKPEEVPPEEKPVEEEAKPEEKEAEKVEVASKPEISPEELAEQQRRRDMEIAKKSGLLSLLANSEIKPVSDEILDKTLSGMKVLRSKRSASSKPGVKLRAAKASGGIDDLVASLESVLKDSKVIVSEKNLGTSGGITSPERAPQSDLALKGRKTTAVRSPFRLKGYGDGDIPRTYREISQVVEKYKGGVSFIYNKALRRDPSLRGTVTVEFTISSAGDVIDCKVASSSMQDAVFEEALVKRILQWQFPPILEGDVTVVYPLVFFVTG